MSFEDNLDFAGDAQRPFPFEDNLVFAEVLFGFLDTSGESNARFLRGRPRFFFTGVALSSIAELATKSRFSPSVVNMGCFRFLLLFEGSWRIVGEALFFSFLDGLSEQGDETEDDGSGESEARLLRGRPRFFFTKVALSSISRLARSSRFSPSVANTGCFRFLLPFEGSRRIVGEALFFSFLDGLSEQGDETEDGASGESNATFLGGRPRLFFTKVALSSISELAIRSRFPPSVMNTGCFRFVLPFEGSRRIAGDELFFGFLDGLSEQGDGTEDGASGESNATFLRGRPRFFFTKVALSSIFEFATRS